MKKKKVEPLPTSELLDEGELPDGWNLTSLNEIGKWRTGGTPSRQINSYFNGDIAWVKSGDLKDGIVTITDEKITESGLQNCAAKLLPVGTVSVALYGATIGKLGILGIEAATNQACANCIVDPKKISKEFLFYYIFSQRQNLIDAGQGGAQPNLTNQIIHDWPIPLPPLAEQQRIVARVEALLTSVNAARDRLYRVPLIMKKFRQAVLAAACSGRLTEGWREENPRIESATIWMEKTGKKSINLIPDLRIPEYLPNLPESWDYCNVDEISQFIGSGITPIGGREVYVSEGIPFIRSQNVYPEGLRLDDIVFVTEKMHKEMKRTHVFPNDVLLNITGASIGRCTCVPEKFIDANVNQHVCIIRVVSEFLPKHLSIFLNSPHGQKQIFDNQGGVTRQGLNYSQLRAIILPVPPLSEQYEIIYRVDLLFRHMNQIEQNQMFAMKKTNALTQAILAKAFIGELLK